MARRPLPPAPARTIGRGGGQGRPAAGPLGAGRSPAAAPSRRHQPRRQGAEPWGRPRGGGPVSTGQLKGDRSSKWVMLKKARRSLFRNVLSATQLKKVESTRQDQIFGVYLAAEQDKLQDFLTQMQTRTKEFPGVRVH